MDQENQELILTLLEVIYNLISEYGLMYEFPNVPRNDYKQFYVLYDEFVKICLNDYKSENGSDETGNYLINIDEKYVQSLINDTQVTDIVKKTDKGLAIPLSVFVDAFNNCVPLINKLLSFPLIGQLVLTASRMYKALKVPQTLGKFCLYFLGLTNLLTYASDLIANSVDFRKLSKALRSQYPDVKIKKWDSILVTNNLLKLFDYKGGYYIDSPHGKFYVDEINDGRLQLALAIAIGYKDVDNLWNLVGVKINDVYVTAPIIWIPNKITISFKLKQEKFAIFDLLQDFGYRNVIF